MAFNCEKTPEFWNQFYSLENKLNVKLRKIERNSDVVYIYNPIEYAATIHCRFLRKYLSGPKKVLFIGLNPGPNGMLQTGKSN